MTRRGRRSRKRDDEILGWVILAFIGSTGGYFLVTKLLIPLVQKLFIPWLYPISWILATGVFSWWLKHDKNRFRKGILPILSLVIVSATGVFYGITEYAVPWWNGFWPWSLVVTILGALVVGFILLCIFAKEGPTTDSGILPSKSLNPPRLENAEIKAALTPKVDTEHERLISTIKSYRPEWKRKTKKHLGSWWTLESNEKSANAELVVHLRMQKFDAKLEINIAQDSRADIVVDNKYVVEAKEDLYSLMPFDRLIGQLSKLRLYSRRYQIIVLIYGEVRPDLEHRLRKETQTPFELIKLWKEPPR